MNMIRSPWGPAEYLGAAMVDLTSWLVWSKTKDAKRGTNKPTPLSRPQDRIGRRKLKDDIQETIEAARETWG